MQKSVGQLLSYVFLSMLLNGVACKGKGSSGAGGDIDYVGEYEGDTGFIVGKLVDADGIPVEGAFVSALLTTGYSPWGDSGEASTRTGADGGFRLGPVPSGRYQLNCFGNPKTHPDTGVSPARDVRVDGGDSSPVTLRLVPVILAEIPFSGKRERASAKQYFESPTQPLANGFATKYLTSTYGDKSRPFRTLPGKIRISLDPTFHKDSEVHDYEIAEDGTVTGGKAIPLPEFFKLEVPVRRSDGKDLGKHSGHLLPASVPGDSIASLPVEVGNSKVFTKGGFSVWVPKGTRVKAVVVAEGCKVAESAPFLTRPDAVPPEIVLQPAAPAEITLKLDGVPDDVLPMIDNGNFTFWFKSPSGIFVQGSNGWMLDEGDDKSFRFAALPAGEVIHARFWRGGPNRIHSKVSIEIADGDEHVIPVSEFTDPMLDQPNLWGGRWWRAGHVIGEYRWQVQVTAPGWF